MRFLIGLTLFIPQLTHAVNFNLYQQFISLGLSTGGYTFAETVNEKVEAGGGFSLQYGINVISSDYLHYQFEIGYKFDSASGYNGDADFNRVYTDLVVLKQSRQIRYGAGVSLHLNPTYTQKITGSEFTSEMPPAFGLLAQLDLLTRKNTSVSFQYEIIEFKPDNIASTSTGGKIKSIDGNSFSIVARFHF